MRNGNAKRYSECSNDNQKTFDIKVTSKQVQDKSIMKSLVEEGKVYYEPFVAGSQQSLI